uniref:Uncharacterized protein LOC113796629 n=1 Tax=Dermatophagoides pteronyssinus TaxID=6956 RepID=A0A6P6YCV0_DERPT|nr:uncharacterized protein LOC113796629 [Dermatophagoides pteronyssinus]
MDFLENLDDNVLHHHYDVASNTDFNDDFLEIFGKDDDDNHRQHRNHRLLSTDNRHQNTDPNKNKSAPISVKKIDGQIINSEDRKQKLLINFRLKLNKYALCKNDSDSFVDPSESECFEKFELLRKMKSIENKQKFHQNVKKTSFFTVEKFIQEKFEENKQNFLRKWWKSICENNLSNVAKLKPNLIENSSELLFYLIIVLFNLDQNYKYCIELCRLKKMPLKFHRKLQQIWDLSWEQLELQRKNVQFLTCVQRFRLKQRNPYPSTITIGSRIKYGIPMKFKKILINYYDNVNKHPTTYDKEKLAEKTKLTVKQVSTFFKNRRNRIR